MSWQEDVKWLRHHADVSWEIELANAYEALTDTVVEEFWVHQRWHTFTEVNPGLILPGDIEALEYAIRDFKRRNNIFDIPVWLEHMPVMDLPFGTPYLRVSTRGRDPFNRVAPGVESIQSQVVTDPDGTYPEDLVREYNIPLAPKLTTRLILNLDHPLGFAYALTLIHNEPSMCTPHDSVSPAERLLRRWQTGLTCDEDRVEMAKALARKYAAEAA